MDVFSRLESALPGLLGSCFILFACLSTVPRERRTREYSRSRSQPEEHSFYDYSSSLYVRSPLRDLPSAAPNNRWRSLGTNRRWYPSIPRPRLSRWSRHSKPQERSPTRLRSRRCEKEETSNEFRCCTLTTFELHPRFWGQTT